MENNKIPIFDNFALVSLIMPFFAKTDKAFRVLSQLSVSSRNKLYEFYEEFRKLMNHYSQVIYISESNLNNLLLPWDLFVFLITLNWIEAIEAFTDFANSIKSKNGYYFRDYYYLHTQVSVNIVNIDLKLTKFLNPHIELLRSIQTTSKAYNSIEEDKIYQSLFDKVWISNFYCRKEANVLSEVSDSNNSDIDLIIKSFNSINCLYFEDNTYLESIEILNNIKKGSMKIGTLFISGETEEELENLTNPEFFNILIHFDYKFNTNHSISSKTLENLNKIQPKIISVDIKYQPPDNHFDFDKWFNFIKVVSSLKNIECLVLSDSSFSTNCWFSFTNAYVKISHESNEYDIF